MLSKYVFGVEDRNGKLILFTDGTSNISGIESGCTVLQTLGSISRIQEETDQFGAVGKVNTIAVILDNTDKQFGKLVYERANFFGINRVFVYEVFQEDWGYKNLVFNGKIDSMTFDGSEVKLNLR
jgi:hypothetical protein